MHKAPPVVWALEGPTCVLRVWLVLWLAVLSVDVLWLLHAGAGDWRPAAALALAALLAVATWRWGRPVAQGSLAWDGNDWWWAHGALRTRGTVTPQLDLQRGLLLRFVSDAHAVHWFWLESAADPSQWRALRRAVHEPAGQGRLRIGPGHGAAGADGAVRP